MGKRELLFSLTKKDFKLQFFRGQGPGGQHRNKNDTAVRITHMESGAVATSQEFKSQNQNKKAALHRLIKTPKFRVWQAMKVQEILTKKTVEQRVEEQMDPKNIRVECKNEKGQWMPWEDIECSVNTS